MNCPCEDNCPAGCPCDDFDCDSGDLPGPEVPEPGDDKMVLVISSHPANKPMFKVDFHGKYGRNVHGPRIRCRPHNLNYGYFREHEL